MLGGGVRIGEPWGAEGAPAEGWAASVWSEPTGTRMVSVWRNSLTLGVGAWADEEGAHGDSQWCSLERVSEPQ